MSSVSNPVIQRPEILTQGMVRAKNSVLIGRQQVNLITLTLITTIIVLKFKMSNVSKIPPKFSSEKNYAQWKKELNAWTCITSHAKKDWGKIIALNLPENDPSNIREKVFSLDLEPLVSDDPNLCNEKQGYDNLIKFMDDEFLKDNITDMCEHIRQFMKLEKRKDEKMKNYVSNFEAAYKKAKEKGLPELPHTYRMYQLLENSKISDHEYMMVLTGISTDSKDLYVDAKKSLLKLFNSSRSQGIQKDGSYVENDPNLDTFWGPSAGQRFN